MEQTPILHPSELYERRRTKDAAKLRAYNRILESIQHRIRVISKLPQSPSYLMYQVPPVTLGAPIIQLEDCITFLVFQLRHQGFIVRYTYPALLYISWEHHERSYLSEQCPITLSMMESAERSQTELERKEREASRLLAPRKSNRKVKFQDPGTLQRGQGMSGMGQGTSHTGHPIPRSAIDTILHRGPSSASASAPPSLSSSSPPSLSAGSPPSAGSYVPNATFLQSVMSPSPAVPKPRTALDEFR
jgi:hypothetical protein